ncbi:MAG: hypothetical protein WDM77_10660 [Steroidobacteraceae bacterium]
MKPIFSIIGHSGRRLTEVGRDPESFYLPPGYLASVGYLHRLVLEANCTLLGRLLLGPAAGHRGLLDTRVPSGAR